MIVLYVFLIILALSSIRFLPKGENWNADYISIDTANVIKGICIWIVFICHISSYMTELTTLNFYDKLLFDVNAYVKQLLVVPFLFYSGYGVTIALKRKGTVYADKMPVNRIFPTLINYDIAVFVFLLMNLCLGLELDWSKTILAFTGWESIRNSNWYIFCILICYAISWAAYKVFGPTKRMIFAIWMSILLYTAILWWFKGHWWYDTIYAYGAGACFAWWKDKAEDTIKKYYWSLVIISVLGFIVSYNGPKLFSISADINAVFLCSLLVIFTCKFRLKNRLLVWSGKHLFPLYIYQRLPMVTFSTIAGGLFINDYRYLYILLCFVITILIASLYKYINFTIKK